MPGVMDSFFLHLVVRASLSKALDLSAPVDAVLMDLPRPMSNGTGTGLVSQMWHDQRTLTASATENLDLAGSLVNAFGVTITLATIKFVFARAAESNTNDVQLIRGAANGVPLFMANGTGIALGPGDWFLWSNKTTGKAVTAGTADILTVTNSAGGTSVVYDLVLVGTD